jgi:hypothetical protein
MGMPVATNNKRIAWFVARLLGWIVVTLLGAAMIFLLDLG